MWYEWPGNPDVEALIPLVRWMLTNAQGVYVEKEPEISTKMCDFCQ